MDLSQRRMLREEITGRSVTCKKNCKFFDKVNQISKIFTHFGFDQVFQFKQPFLSSGNFCFFLVVLMFTWFEFH